jgi:hypothetical protein
VYINWKGPLITINPQHGTNLEGSPPKGIKVPNYGNFGGPLISGQGGGPVDSLDEHFKDHDAAIGTEGLLAAHAELIGDILALNETNDGLLEVKRASGEIIADPEATLYAGFTLFALTAQVVQLDQLDDFETELADLKPALNVSTVLTNAAEYMETGLKAVPNEGKGLNGLFHIWEKQFSEFIA